MRFQEERGSWFGGLVGMGHRHMGGGWAVFGKQCLGRRGNCCCLRVRALGSGSSGGRS